MKKGRLEMKSSISTILFATGVIITLLIGFVSESSQTRRANDTSKFDPKWSSSN